MARKDGPVAGVPAQELHQHWPFAGVIHPMGLFQMACPPSACPRWLFLD
jgi:hypothetical protein